MKIKAFIINRDLLTWPKGLVESIQQKWPDTVEPVIIDNASSYNPLLEWYDTNPCRVIRLDHNYRHKVLWTSGLFYSEVKEDYYIVSDPDIDISSVPEDTIEVMIRGVEKYAQPKIGLALKIDDLPEESPNTAQVLAWESEHWKRPLEDHFYAAPVDTTFSLCSTARNKAHSVSGIRLGGPYTCKHLPYYLTPDNVTPEYGYYLEHRARLEPDDINFRNRFSTWVSEALKNE